MRMSLAVLLGGVLLWAMPAQANAPTSSGAAPSTGAAGATMPAATTKLAVVNMPAATAATMPAASTQAAGPGDSRLRAAGEWVLKSDRYLHHSKLRRGMKGYGLTVLDGAAIVRFEVEIVSVMSGTEPQHDKVLARLSGAGLEQTGVISGMSGSPVFVQDAGRDKLIGAVAFGWRFQKDAGAGHLCGIQPITYMLAVSGVPLGGQAATQPAASPAGGTQSAAGQPGGPAHGLASLSPAWRALAFQAEKVDFSRLNLRQAGATDAALADVAQADAGMAGNAGRSDAEGDALRMRPLATPLMAGGLGERAMEHLARCLADRNLVPVQAGGIGGQLPDAARDIQLQPGSALAVLLVTGDEELTAVGTVTDVIGGHVIGFGHAMDGNGAVSYPMATGYIHAVVPNLMTSFKLGGAVRPVGELTADEYTGVGGLIGPRVDMIPMTIDVSWEPEGQKQTFNYRVVRDQGMTPLLSVVLALDTLSATRKMPLEHTLEYSVTVDFGPLGRYVAENFSSGREGQDMISDLARPVLLMLNNPFGTARVESVKVQASVREGTRRAVAMDLKLDRNRYAPGETVKASVEIWPQKAEGFTKTVEVALPADLPDGQYKLTLGGWDMALKTLQRLEPRKFDPRDLAELLGSIRLATAYRMDRLYAVLDLPGQDVDLGDQTLKDPPPTIAALLEAARPVDVSPAGRSVTADLPVGMVVSGSVQATITVTKHPPRP